MRTDSNCLKLICGKKWTMVFTLSVFLINHTSTLTHDCVVILLLGIYPLHNFCHVYLPRERSRRQTSVCSNTDNKVVHEPYTEPYTVCNESNSNASEYRKQMCHHKALTSLDGSELKSNTSAKITTTLTTAWQPPVVPCRVHLLKVSGVMDGVQQ